jgi:hypothetical protein
LCEALPGLTPEIVCGWSHDQILTVATERKRLKRISGGRVTGTSAELASHGMLPEGYQRGKSVARELMEKEQARKKAEVEKARAKKRKRRTR